MKTDARTNAVLLIVNFPMWFRVLYAVGGPFVLFSISNAMLNIARDESGLSIVLKGGFLFLIVGLGAWVIPIFFSTIYATRSGIHRRGLLGRMQKFTWDEIRTVATPRLSIPGDAAYIISKSGARMTIARSMTGYPELLRLIQEKAPEVKVNGLPENLFVPNRANSWRGIVIFLALFLAYVIIRKLAGW